MGSRFPISALQFEGKSHIRQINRAAKLIWYQNGRTIPMEVAITEALRQHREYLIKTEKWKRGMQHSLSKLKRGELQYKNEDGKWVNMDDVMES